MRFVWVAVMLLGGVAGAQVPDGIPRELARERAAVVQDVRYELAYTLVPKAGVTQASEVLRFGLKRLDGPLLVDFRDGAVLSLDMNGRALTAEVSHGHIVLPKSALRVGENTVKVAFAANVAAAEKAITRYGDRDDGAEYLYTLFVPMDAEMAFPCFDQPDLKARFTLSVSAPDAWTVVSNTAVTTRAAGNNGVTTTSFGETEPISTYLFAFAAGPFVKVHDVAGLPGLYVRKSKVKEAEAEAPAVQQMAADGIKYLGDYFAQPFPFPKYDMVLIPGFAYGGMEHAGATFLKEEGVLFRSAPTATNLFNRDILVLHELTHQWFGDFTTMRWFDDLWLKEGFAQYTAYQTLSVLKPQDNVWKRFYEAIKPAAYGIDETQGTTPIYQDIPNLKDAKSAYGAIVYQKAPGVLKQLAFVLGEENFRKGLQVYLAGHRYGNAEWSDLIAAFEAVSGQSLGVWADAWIRHRGMPQVTATWSCADGKLAKLELAQKDVLGTETVWPIATEVLLANTDGTKETVRAQLNARAAKVDAAVGKACPAYVFANDSDHAYGLFLMDEKSLGFVTGHLGAVPDLFERTLLWGSLWQTVTAAKFDPARYVELALTTLPAERDEALTASVVGRSSVALHKFVGDATRAKLTAQMQAMAKDRMVNDESKDLRIVWFRALPGLSEQAAGRETLKALLDGSLKVPGVALRQQDRWRLITALVAYGDADAQKVAEIEMRRDPSGDAGKYMYEAFAAKPDKETKANYFHQYLTVYRDLPEDWVSDSLGAFNEWNQSALTAPYLKPSLEALAQIKQTRKIFFLVGWLNAFIGGQQSEEAQRQVYAYLKTAQIDKDLRLKILQAVDELDKTVAVRKAYARP